MAGPTDPKNDDSADMDNPQMKFVGDWFYGPGPTNCQVDNDKMAFTNTIGGNMTRQFTINDNVLDIVGGSQLSTGALISIQLDGFQTHIDTSLLGSYPLVAGATNQDSGACSYLASIGGIKAGSAHNVTITLLGAGKNTDPGVQPTLALSTLIWRDGSQDNLTTLQEVESPSQNFPPTTSLPATSLSPTSLPTAPVGATGGPPVSGHSDKTLGLAIGITVVVLAVIGFSLFGWLYTRGRKRSLISRRGVKIISPPESLQTSFSSMAFEKKNSTPRSPQRPTSITNHRPTSIASHRYNPSSVGSVELSYIPGAPSDIPPVRRVSRKPVPRPSTAEQEDGRLSAIELPPSTISHSRPDSDTLVRNNTKDSP